MNRSISVFAVVLSAGLTTVTLTTAGQADHDSVSFSDDSGVQRTIGISRLDADNAFFQDLGSNGRSCVTCHQPDQAWSVTPERIRERFERTQGLDPIFRTNDGSNCGDADVSSMSKRRTAYSQLMTRGLIRVGMSVPADAEFTIESVDDPYQCNAPLTDAALYRRPLPSTNLGFLSTVMWDGRETVKGQSIRADLESQANDATMGHAQGTALPAALIKDIVDFETRLFTAQTQDHHAGSLTADGAQGGPRALSTQPFCVGVNDPLNILPVMPGACATSSGGLNTDVFTLFGAWANDSPARRAIARGEAIFNTRTFVIDNVGGLNRDAADPVAGAFAGTCTVCHNTPNAGDHSIAMPLDLGLTDASHRTANLPLYLLRNKATQATTTTTDPGRAMVTGKWTDIGKFKGPVLRALAARAPYFHNGAAATLDEAVDFYDTRFHIGLTPREKADLVAFLKAL
jgi:cytochrome c peroxidase